MKFFIRPLALILIAAVLTLCSCGEKNEFSDVEFDIEALAQSLYEGCVYADQLSRLSDELASTRYAFGGEKSVVYAGSGATAEIIVVVEYSDKMTASNSLYMLKNYLEDQISAYEDYNANELPKLHSALCRAYGRYAVLCVSADSAKAAEIVENY